MVLEPEAGVGKPVGCDRGGLICLLFCFVSFTIISEIGLQPPVPAGAGLRLWVYEISEDTQCGSVGFFPLPLRFFFFFFVKEKYFFKTKIFG